MDKNPSVYILASKRNGTLYTGATSDLVKRIWEHKNNLVEVFKKRYSIHNLIWYEIHENMEQQFLWKRELRSGNECGKWNWLKEVILIGRIYIMILFDWIPASAGMTTQRKHESLVNRPPRHYGPAIGTG